MPIRLKSPTVSASDYPKSILIGNVLDFVLSVSVPALTCEYSVSKSHSLTQGVGMYVHTYIHHGELFRTNRN